MTQCCLQVQWHSQACGEVGRTTGQQGGVPDLSHLTLCQQRELLAILAGLFQEKLGITSVVEHTITLKDTVRVSRKMHRVPECLLSAFKKEVVEMLALGVIERSSSEWSSSEVLST